MQNVNISQNKSVHSKSLIKIFFVVVTLVLVCVLAVLWAINSKSFANYIITYAVQSIQVSDGVTYEVASISGNIYNGIKISEISIKSIKDNAAIKVAQVGIKFSFGTIGKKSRPEVSLRCQKIDITGFTKSILVDKIPKVPMSSCFAGVKIPVFVKRLKIDRINVIPFASHQDEYTLKLAYYSILPQYILSIVMLWGLNI